MTDDRDANGHREHGRPNGDGERPHGPQPQNLEGDRRDGYDGRERPSRDHDGPQLSAFGAIGSPNPHDQGDKAGEDPEREKRQGRDLDDVGCHQQDRAKTVVEPCVA